MKKSPQKKVMCDTGRVSTYYVHQHGEGELIEKETIEMPQQKITDAHPFITTIEHHQYIRNSHQYSRSFSRNEGT